MCNQANCNHLDDDLADILGSDPVSHELADYAVSQVRMHEETCPACRGSGQFRSYTGRIVGQCFKCKGKGKRFFKTSSAERAQKREQAAAKREEKQAEIHAKAVAWLEANPAEREWLLEGKLRGFEFAVSMYQALQQYGHFTERQEAAVRSATAKSAERKAQWAAEKAAREEGAAVLSMAKIRAGFDSAIQHLKRPKLRIADIQFSLAPASGRNAGCIYVVRASDDTYLGKITQEDKFITSRDCNATDSETVARVAADPKAAAEAHGHEYGQCSCCGRELTNPESVARGIGPICAERWGF